jgi:hypothetical protein
MGALLNIPTVLVLGAGASVPFGFPTGRQLSELLCKDLMAERAGAGFHILRDRCGYSADQIEDFRLAFFRSGKSSVDAFLEHRTDFKDIGIAAIAQALIRYENEGELFGFDESNWLREMIIRLNTAFDDFGKNRLSFVTFNYDRTVEHFLFSSLKHGYGKTDEECAAVLDNIPVIHLHGRLGYLPWQSRSESRAFHTDIDQQGLKAAIDNIKIIHEPITDGRDVDFKSAKAKLAEAEQVVVMGFGYNATNVERLGLADLQEGKAIGTCEGLGSRGEDAARRACNGKVRLLGGNCIRFVREEMNWE